MKILVFSDSHGRYANIQRALSMHTDADLLLHLGDGKGDLFTARDAVFGTDKKPKTAAVNGNFEDGVLMVGKKDGSSRLILNIEGKKILMCHGHREKVGFGLQSLVYTALEAGADVALYGHTHVKHNEYMPSDDDTHPSGLYVFNPGSISLPRDSIKASYGVIEIKNGGILLSHGFIG